jgi:hypothetical protein
MTAAILIILICFLLCGLKGVAAAGRISDARAVNGGFPEDTKTFSLRNAIQNPFVQAENRTHATGISGQIIPRRLAETVWMVWGFPKSMTHSKIITDSDVFGM